jgi:hypothetical protein
VKPDPVFSGDAFKAGALLVVALVIGVGVWAVASGNLSIGLPDINLPDNSSSPSTNLQNTDLSNTTIDPRPQPVTKPSAPANPVGDPFSSAGLSRSIAAVESQIGGGRELTSLTINEVQTQFIVRRGKDIEAWNVRAEDGSITRQDASISISGNATIADFAFKLDSVKTGAVDRMLAATRKASGAPEIRPTVLRLERDLSGGLKPPEWTINFEGNGRYLTYKANARGGAVHNVGGQGVQVPPAAIEARKLNDCIQRASGDVDAIQSCFKDFNP